MSELTHSPRPTVQLHSVTIGDPAREGATRIVFLHGLFGRGKNFTGIASALADEASSLLVDLPNHGQSDWTETFSYESMADAVAAHLREGFAGGRAVDVVGHSMGGKVAILLALRHPDLVRHLVVIDISPTAGDLSRSTFPHLLDSLASVDLASLERRSDAGRALRERIPEDGVRGFLLQNLMQTSEGFAWQPNLALLRERIVDVMGFPDVKGLSFDGPVLWIGGGRSEYITDADEPAMRVLFPRTRRLTVKGAGHWVHSEAPDVVIAALRRFLLSQ